MATIDPRHPSFISLSKAIPSLIPSVPPGVAFSGKLASLSLMDLVQMTCLSGQSVRIEVRAAGNEKAMVWIRNGRVVDASFQGTTGQDAFFKLAAEAKGSFWVFEDTSVIPARIAMGWQELLIECARLSDEGAEKQNAEVQLDDIDFAFSDMERPAPVSTQQAFDVIQLISKRSFTFFGKHIIANYWRTTRPNGLESIFAVSAEGDLVCINTNVDMSDEELKALHSWISAYIARAGRIVSDVAVHLRDALSDEQATIAGMNSIVDLRKRDENR